jgi:hypothetical protein
MAADALSGLLALDEAVARVTAIADVPVIFLIAAEIVAEADGTETVMGIVETVSLANKYFKRVVDVVLVIGMAAVGVSFLETLGAIVDVVTSVVIADALLATLTTLVEAVMSDTVIGTAAEE